MAGATRKLRVLVMGVGNTLMQDDGVGSRVIEELAGFSDPALSLDLVDGGTIGLSLLPKLEDADAVIVVDAAELGDAAGSLQLFHGDAIDRQLSGKRRTVHEVALLDLFSAAAIRGNMPPHRTLVAIQPGCTDWGLELTPPVEAAVPQACEVIRQLARQWRNEARAA